LRIKVGLTKELGFIKVKCRKCGHINLVPVVNKRIAIEDVARCEKCGNVIAEPKELIRILKKRS